MKSLALILSISVFGVFGALVMATWRAQPPVVTDAVPVVAPAGERTPLSLAPEAGGLWMGIRTGDANTCFGFQACADAIRGDVQSDLVCMSGSTNAGNGCVREPHTP